jgi:hypothetical protein
MAWSALSGDLAPNVTISIPGLPDVVAGERLLIFGSGGTFSGSSGTGCTVASAYGWLDLARYPNAVADMKRLRTFFADRATFDAVRSAGIAVDATVTAVGTPTPPDYLAGSEPGSSVDVTLQSNTPLCGDAGVTIRASHFHYVNGGIANPAGSTPAVGFRGVFLLQAGPVGPALHIVGRFESTDVPRLASLLATPPSLSL